MIPVAKGAAALVPPKFIVLEQAFKEPNVRF